MFYRQKSKRLCTKIVPQNNYNKTSWNVNLTSKTRKGTIEVYNKTSCVGLILKLILWKDKVYLNASDENSFFLFYSRKQQRKSLFSNFTSLFLPPDKSFPMNFCNIKFYDKSYWFWIKTADNFVISVENSISLKPLGTQEKFQTLKDLKDSKQLSMQIILFTFSPHPRSSLRRDGKLWKWCFHIPILNT